MNGQIEITETQTYNNKGEIAYNIAVFNSYKIKEKLKYLSSEFRTNYGVNCWRKDYATKQVRDKVREIVEEANNSHVERERTFTTLAEA